MGINTYQVLWGPRITLLHILVQLAIRKAVCKCFHQPLSLHVQEGNIAKVPKRHAKWNA